MQFKEFKKLIKVLGFETFEDFLEFSKYTSNDLIKWEQADEVPYVVSLLLHLLKGDKNIAGDNIELSKVIEECLPLATLLEEASSFPSKLEEMFKLQKKLNDSTNGENWELGINKYKKEINWLRCIYMEVSELVDSTPWKHWKNINSVSDVNNIHIELVDIWHFLMSYILKEFNIPKSVSLVNTHCIYEAKKYSEINSKEIVEEAEKLSYIAFAILTKNIPTFSGVDRFIDQFFRCCKISGLSFMGLQKLYIGKNCLNQFRQDNGYKEGYYKKDWNGIEDNVVMMKIINNMEDVTLKVLYKKLENEYKLIK